MGSRDKHPVMTAGLEGRCGMLFTSGSRADFQLAIRCGAAHTARMDDISPSTPNGWTETLKESETDLAAGRVVSAEQVMRDIRDGISRLRKETLANGTESARRA